MLTKRDHSHLWLHKLSFPEQLDEICVAAWQGIANGGGSGLRSKMSLMVSALLSVGYVRGWNDAVDAMAAIQEKDGDGPN